jgi:hypothetical protein
MGIVSEFYFYFLSRTETFSTLPLQGASRGEAGSALTARHLHLAQVQV